mgnify:CR=1 FL=1
MKCVFECATKRSDCLDKITEIDNIVGGYNTMCISLLRKYRNSAFYINISYVVDGKWTTNSWSMPIQDYCVFTTFIPLKYYQRLFIYVLQYQQEE